MTEKEKQSRSDKYGLTVNGKRISGSEKSKFQTVIQGNCQDVVIGQQEVEITFGPNGQITKKTKGEQK